MLPKKKKHKNRKSNDDWKKSMEKKIKSRPDEFHPKVLAVQKKFKINPPKNPKMNTMITKTHGWLKMTITIKIFSNFIYELLIWGQIEI